MSHASRALAILADLRDRTGTLRFADPVTHVYNPLEYAWASVRQYIERFGDGPRRVLFLGMNPGPWGMTQTGVPFGEVAAVRDWLQIDAPMGKPADEHPKRPVDGLACARSEVSGQRLWRLFADRFATADEFFAEHLVLNHCPLVFMEESGRNRTPDKLPLAERKPLLAICDEALIALLDVYQPQWCVGVGEFAEKRLQCVATDGIKVGRVLHPSPASPAANRGWEPQALAQLLEQGIWTDRELKKGLGE